MRDMTSVYGYGDAEYLGEASDELIAASRAADPTGAVLAYLGNDGVWQHVAASDVSTHLAAGGEEPQTVYVAD